MVDLVNEFTNPHFGNSVIYLGLTKNLIIFWAFSYCTIHTLGI